MDWLTHNFSWIIGAACNIATYVALVREHRETEEKRRREAAGINGQQALQFELMWKDFKERKRINGGGIPT